MRNFVSWVLSVTLLAILGVQTAAARTGDVIPQNIRLSYILEITNNPAMTSKNFEDMAAAVISRQRGISLEKARAFAGRLGLHEIKQLAIQEFPLEYYEIPLELLRRDGEFKLENPAVQIVERGGQKYVRWFYHPLHENSYIRTRYKEYLGKSTIVGMLTSSRSMIVGDTETGDVYGVKTSLERSYGPLRGETKTYKSSEAEFHFGISSLLQKDPILKNVFFEESGYVAFKVSEDISAQTFKANDKKVLFDEGQVVRSLKPFENGHYIVALATVFNDKIGAKIASASDEVSAQAFLDHKVVPELADVVAYQYAKYGLAHNSLHSQNLCVRLDKDFRYLSIALRDPDFDVNKDVAPPEALVPFKSTNHVRDNGSMGIDFGIIHAMEHLDNTKNIRSKFHELAMSFAFYFVRAYLKYKNIDVALSEELLKWRIRSVLRTERSRLGLTPKRIDTITGQLPLTHAAEPLPMPVSEAKILIEKQLQDDSIYLHNTVRIEDQAAAWREIIEDFRRDPTTSVIGRILSGQSPEKIADCLRRLLVIENISIDDFISTVAVYYPDLIGQDQFVSPSGASDFPFVGILRGKRSLSLKTFNLLVAKLSPSQVRRYLWNALAKDRGFSLDYEGLPTERLLTRLPTADLVAFRDLVMHALTDTYPRISYETKQQVDDLTQKILGRRQRPKSQAAQVCAGDMASTFVITTRAN